MAMLLAGVSFSSCYVVPFGETLKGGTLVPGVWHSVSSLWVEVPATVT